MLPQKKQKNKTEKKKTKKKDIQDTFQEIFLFQLIYLKMFWG